MDRTKKAGEVSTGKNKWHRVFVDNCDFCRKVIVLSPMFRTNYGSEICEECYANKTIDSI